MRLLLALCFVLLRHVHSCSCRSVAAQLHDLSAERAHDALETFELQRHVLPELLELLVEQGFPEILQRERVQGDVARLMTEPGAGNNVTRIKWKKSNPVLPPKERREPMTPIAIIVTNLPALAGLRRRGFSEGTGSSKISHPRHYQKVKPQQSKSNQTHVNSKQLDDDPNRNTDVSDTEDSGVNADLNVTSELDVISSSSSNELDISKEKLAASELDITSSELDISKEKHSASELDVTSSELDIFKEKHSASELDVTSSELDISKEKHSASELDVTSSELDISKEKLAASELDITSSELDISKEKHSASELDVTSSELDIFKEKHSASELDVTSSELDISSKRGVNSEIEVTKNTDVTNERLRAGNEGISVDAAAEDRIIKKIVIDSDVKLEVVTEPGADSSVVGSGTPARHAEARAKYYGPCKETREDGDWTRRRSNRKTYNISFLFNR